MNATLTRATVAAVLLLLAGCASSSAPSSDTAGSSQPTAAARPTIDITPSTITITTSPSSAPTSAAPTSCDPGPDILVWMRTAGVDDYAQRLGSRGGADCTSTFDLMQQSAPTTPGSCTEAAWASDNPGYDENATPAKRLKKVRFSIGPAC